MAKSFFLRLICLVALIYCHSQVASLPTVNEDQAVYWLSKRVSSNRLRSFTPLFIFQQSIRKPRYASPRPTSYNIPRRWVRRGSDINRNVPMKVWNHQLLPKFNERLRFYNFYSSRGRENVPKRSDKQWQFPNSLPNFNSPFGQFAFDSDDQYTPEPEALNLPKLNQNLPKHDD